MISDQDRYKFNSYMLPIFRKAIPEISDRAILFFVHDNPTRFPGTGEQIGLTKHKIEEPDGALFEFTIARLLLDESFEELREIIFVQSFELEEYPEYKFYIKETKTGGTVIRHSIRGEVRESPAPSS